MGAGRPAMYKNAEEMQAIIDKYFEECKGEVLKDDEGNIVYNKYGMPVIINSKPPTVTGLALALGFNTRLSLLNYQDKEEFVNTVTRAKARIEEYAEARLFDKDGVQGAKFSLANNFREWREKQEVESTNHNLNEDISNLTDADKEHRLAELTAKKYGIPIEQLKKWGNNG